MARERVLVFNQTRESVLSLGADVADGLIDRWGGLALGAHLRPGGGLWINASRVLHTIGVTSPVDVVCLDPSSQVVDIQEDFRPFHVKLLGEHISSFLELPRRTVRESKTEIGDELAISPSEPVQPVLALYTNGGPVEPHVVQNLTKKGAVVQTEDRWYPGTVVDMTLRYDDHYAKLSKMGKASDDSVHVRAKVVGSAADGVRVEFIFLKRAEKRDFKRFARRV
jgi:uncharacterized membrane protein (UPF0127 family)